jgi:membrane-bound serine protease (ClpP class)
MGVAETLLLIAALIVAAMIMIVAEICTPTFGVLAVAAIAAVGWAVYLCYTLNAVAGLAATIAAVILMPAYTVVAVKTLPKTGLGRRMGLRREAVQAGEGTPEAEDLSRYIGRVTTAETLLRPSGFVRIDGNRIVAEAESGLIEKGRQVKVIRAGGTSVTVRKVEA